MITDDRQQDRAQPRKAFISHGSLTFAAFVAIIAVILCASVACLAWALKERASSQACEAVTQYLAEAGTVQTVGSGTLRVTVLGDSYVAGDGLPDRSLRWANELAELMDATVTIDAIGGSGYVNGGCTDEPFTTRAHILNESADIVLVAGGLNDTGASAADFLAAVDETLRDIRSTATVYVVGPTHTPTHGPVLWMDRVLESAASAHSVGYIRTLAWRLPYLGDGVHLTVGGHRLYAHNIAAVLQRE